MKKLNTLILFALSLAWISQAGEKPAFTVVIPESSGSEWSIPGAGDKLHMVQQSVEQALINEGYDVISVTDAAAFASWFEGGRLVNTAGMMVVAAQRGADYLVSGQATAHPGSASTAYGIRVYRSSATVTWRVIRISDQKVILSGSTDKTGAGDGAATSANEALKEAGKDAGKKIIEAIPTLLKKDDTAQ